MARRRPDTREATHTLQEIEGVFDRMANRVAEHPVAAVVVLVAILAGAAAVSVYRWQAERSASEASRAVAEVDSAYLEAMGAEPGTVEVTDPEDPAKAAAVRKEYAPRFAEVAAAHAGTAAAVSARLEAGRLYEAVGDLEAAIAQWREATEEAPGGALEAIARVQLARGLETRGKWAEAAAQHEEAGAIEDYPARAHALAHAARCWANAGETERALEAFERAESATPSIDIPTHIAARMRELRVAQP